MAKFNDIRALADNHAREISQSPRDWTGFTAMTLLIVCLFMHSDRRQPPARSWRFGTARCPAGSTVAQRVLL